MLEYCAEISLRDFSYLCFKEHFVWIICRRVTQEGTRKLSFKLGLFCVRYINMDSSQVLFVQLKLLVKYCMCIR